MRPASQRRLSSLKIGLNHSPSLTFSSVIIAWLATVEIRKMNPRERLSERLLKQKLARCSRYHQLSHVNESESNQERCNVFSTPTPQDKSLSWQCWRKGGKNIYITSNRQSSGPLRETANQHLPRSQQSTHTLGQQFSPPNPKGLYSTAGKEKFQRHDFMSHFYYAFTV